MERKRINASNIRSVGYDPASRVLEVEFTSGAVYQYENVSAETHRRLMQSSSAGSFFKDNIEEEYRARRIR